MIYYDARTDDSRLTLTVAKTAENYGAIMVNYIEAVGFIYDSNSKVVGLKAKVKRFDTSPTADEVIDVGAKVIIHATGVYSDEVRVIDEGSHPKSIVPAKEVHIAVEGKKLPCNIACVIPVRKDRRSIFVIPWGNETYIGTTDTEFSGDLFNPDCTTEDIDYLIQAVNDSTTANIKRSDVLGAWSGLRPLLKEGSNKKRLSSKTADLSRQHKVTRSKSDLITVTGGKLTTYRKMAQDCVDLACQMLNVSSKCRTKKLSLMGSPGNKKIFGIGVVDKKPSPKQGADVILYDHLYRRFGTVADDLVALMKRQPELAEPLVANQPYRYVEVHYGIHHEWAQTIEDVMARRTRADIFDEKATMEAVDKLADFMAGELNWSDDFKKEQIESYRSEMTKFYSFEH
jgi:glycerol-3-phosphate dehydrogenase